MNFSDSRLSFFNHFPTLTLTLYDFSLKGAPPFQTDTLVATKEIALGVDLLSIFKGEMNVNKVYFSDGIINIKISEKGEENYDIYASTGSSDKNAADSSKETKLKIEKLLVENATLIYDDRSFPMMFKAVGFNYTGKGDLSKSIFDLTSEADIESFDFNYDNQYYFESKKIHGDLVTQINTNSLTLMFKRNDLKINDLPVDFTGMFEFLENGYNMDFNIQSKSTALKNIITALPKDYIQWMNATDLKGVANMGIRLAGKYVGDTEIKPDLSLKMDIREGYIAHNSAPEPLKNLHLDFETTIPGLNPDSLSVNIDSISFTIEKGYFGGMLHIKGIENPHIDTRIHSAIDLAKLQRATGLKGFEMRGNYSLHLLAKGNFIQTQNPKSSVPDTIVTSIPSFDLKSSISNGFFKNASTQQPVNNISFDIKANCPDHDYKNTNISLKNLDASYLSNYIKGNLDYYGGIQMKVDAKMKALLRLSSLEKIYPVDSLNMEGDLRFDVTAKGKIDIDKKIFPATNAIINLKNGLIQTKYYPRPIEKINIDALVKISDGSLRNTSLLVKPLSFYFEEQPFELKASLKNFNNLRYDISAKGAADLGHISKVFALEDFDYSGYLKVNMSMRGLEQDVKAGNYKKLYNVGTLELRDIEVNSKYFPLPFHVNEGKFHFNHDTLLIDAISMKYGKSDLMLNGHIDNMLNYYFENDAINGQFNLKSKLVDLNQFMSASETNTSSTTATPVTGNNSAVPTAPVNPGVIIVPSNLNISLKAEAQYVIFSNLTLTDVKSDLSINTGILKMNHAGFTLIDAPVAMEATYYSISPSKAYFEYHINAKAFDIKRAYKEISIFREMVTSAANAEGIISLDYSLKGKLNEGMSPIYPSLEGEGTLSVLKAKIKGFKLFTAVSKAAEKDSLNNPNLSNVDIKTSIKNNIITLKPVKMRIAGFRPKIQGQTSFDGKLNLKFRLGLPPLGIVGIPFNITGTQSNPIVKMGRGKNNEPLTEISEEEE
jgi:AsmA protein